MITLDFRVVWVSQLGTESITIYLFVFSAMHMLTPYHITKKILFSHLFSAYFPLWTVIMFTNSREKRSIIIAFFLLLIKKQLIIPQRLFVRLKSSAKEILVGRTTMFYDLIFRYTVHSRCSR